MQNEALCPPLKRVENIFEKLLPSEDVFTILRNLCVEARPLNTSDLVGVRTAFGR